MLPNEQQVTYLLRPRIRQAPHQVQDQRGQIPRDIKKQGNDKYSPKRQEAVTHALGRVMRHNMRNFMPKHCSQPIFILADGQDASVDEDLPSVKR